MLNQSDDQLMPASENTSEPVPHLDVRFPSTVNAWERVKVTVVVVNVTRRAVLPVALELRSAQGLIESWGIERRSTCWGVMMPGRMTGSRFEVLAGMELQQQQSGPPSQLYREVNTHLVRFEPLMPGASVESSTYFDAAYQHGDRVDATFEYITLDPKTRTICVAHESSAPLSFVECSPVNAVEQKSSLHLYMPAEELTRNPGRVSQSAHLTIRHPVFDLDAARARAGIAAGPFGYDIVTERWILVDEPAQRTRVVSEQGVIEDLPGQWLDLLVMLGHADEVSISWNTDAVPLTDTSRQILSEGGIKVDLFKHKDYASPANIVMTVSHIHVSNLGRLMQDMGVRLDGLKVVK